MNWNPNEILFDLHFIQIRYYSLMYVIAFVLGFYIMKKIFLKENKSLERLDSLVIYVGLAMLIGARLGHCFFYDASYFIAHPLEAILPIKFLPNNDWKFVGYAGLASHGGTIGLIFSLFLFCKKTKMRFLKILDMIAIAAPLAAGFIRIANFMNSEIIGTETNLPWGVVFIQVDTVIRHPAQLYESIAYFTFFSVIWLIYTHRNRLKVKSGFYFGLCIFMIFTFRFFVEFIKERQVSFEDNLILDMGQILSLPFIVIGIYFILRAVNLKKLF